MNKKKYSFLTKNIGLFSLSSIFPKILAFILIPIYTKKLTTYEYGLVELLHTTVQLLLPVFTLTIQDAVMRYTFDDTIDKKSVFSSAFWINVIGTGMIALGCAVLKIFGVLPLDLFYIIFLILLFWINGIQNTLSRFCRGINRVTLIVVTSIVSNILLATANILFLLVFNLGLKGYMLAELLSGLCGISCYFFGAKLYKYITFRIPKSIAIQMIKFSFPMIFSALAWWVNNASDRYILSWMAGVSISGIYALSSKIPTILAQVQNVFQQAWSISAIKDFDKNDSDGFIGNVFLLLSFVMCAACSFIMLLNIPAAKILYSGEFFEAWRYVPALLLSVLFNGISLFLDGIFLAAKDTKLISLSTILGATVNTFFNIVLIPLFSAYGAAISTMLGYGAGLVFRLASAKKHIVMKYNQRKVAVGYGLLLIQMMLAFSGAKLWLIQCIFLIGIILLYKQEWEAVILPILKKVNLKANK